MDAGYQILPLAQVIDRFVRNTPGKGEEEVDTIARDGLESVAMGVVPPGRSARPFEADVKKAFGGELGGVVADSLVGCELPRLDPRVCREAHSGGTHC